MDDTETAMIGNVAHVRSKILSSLVSQFNFSGQLKEGMLPYNFVEMLLSAVSGIGMRIYYYVVGQFVII